LTCSIRDRRRPQSQGDGIRCRCLPSQRPRQILISSYLKPEAVALLKTHIYHTAPVTHLSVPKLKQMDAVRAGFDPNGNPKKTTSPVCLGGASQGTFSPKSWTQDMGRNFEVDPKFTRCDFLRAHVILERKKTTGRTADGPLKNWGERLDSCRNRDCSVVCESITWQYMRRIYAGYFFVFIRSFTVCLRLQLSSYRLMKGPARTARTDQAKMWGSVGKWELYNSV
jgi:hypothetical protein